MEVTVDSYVIVLAGNGTSQVDVEEVIAFARERGFWEAVSLPIEGEIAGTNQTPSVQRFLRSTGLDKNGRTGDRLRRLGVTLFHNLEGCNVRDVWAELTRDDPDNLGAKCFLRILEKMRDLEAVFADWDLVPKRDIDDLHLPTFIKNTLNRNGVDEEGVLQRLEDDDILDMHHLGSKALADIKEALGGI